MRHMRAKRLGGVIREDARLHCRGKIVVVVHRWGKSVEWIDVASALIAKLAAGQLDE